MVTINTVALVAIFIVLIVSLIMSSAFFILNGQLENQNERLKLLLEKNKIAL